MSITQSEQREVRKVVNHARTNPHYAAAVLAPLLRAASKRSFPELVAAARATAGTAAATGPPSARR